MSACVYVCECVCVCVCVCEGEGGSIWGGGAERKIDMATQ